MRVLVATSQLQGSADGDYCWTLEGELVLTGPLLECASSERCGCGRGFPGLGSCRATTTATVVERPEIDRALLADVIRDSLDREGWLRELDPDEIEDAVHEEVRLIERVTTSFPVGAVLARSGTTVWQRARRAA